MLVLTSQDFEYLGVMKVPADVSGFGSGAFAFRKPAGALRFFLSGHPANGHPIFEISVPGFNVNFTMAARASVLKAWGLVHNMEITGTASAPWLGDLEWFNGLLYWVYYDSYNVAGNDDPAIGVSMLTEPTPIISGPWRTTASSHKTGGYVTTIPQWYANLYTRGFRLAVGSGLTSGNAGSSWGPQLAAVRPPTSAIPTTTTLETVPLVDHYPYNDLSQRYRREPNYIANGSPDVPPDTGGGYWTQADFIQGAIWIDLPDKHGVIFFGFLGTDNVWYGPGVPDPTYPNTFTDPCNPGNVGPHSENHTPRWWIYDPMKFNAVTSGALNVRADSVINPQVAIDSRLQFACEPSITGSAFDPDTRTLYVVATQVDVELSTTDPLPVVYAFRIKV